MKKRKICSIFNSFLAAATAAAHTLTENSQFTQSSQSVRRPSALLSEEARAVCRALAAAPFGNIDFSPRTMWSMLYATLQQLQQPSVRRASLKALG